ncbi:MAG: carbohydrate ABC transporter permease [Burkholderiales bacterium]
MNSKLSGSNWLFYIVLTVFMIIIVFPFLWVLITSIKPGSEVFGEGAYNVFTSNPTLKNYGTILDKGITTSIINSIVVSTITMVYVVVIASMMAYAISRFNFKGKNLILGLVLAVSMFPQMIIVGPVYNIFMALGWNNSYWVVLPYSTITLPLAVWIMVSHFKKIPISIEESARIDGAPPFKILWRIVFPLAAPGIFTAAIISFIAAWNEYLLTVTLNTNINYHTVPVAISFLRTQFQILWGEVTAATIIVAIPTLVLVLLFQRKIISGLVSGAVKE